MSDHMQVVQELSGRGITLRTLALTHVVRFSHASDGSLAEQREMDGRFCLEVTLQNAGVLLEPGAFHYSHGRIEAEVQAQVKGGFLSRAVQTTGTGESAFATRLRGDGKVFTEPGRRHFILATMESDADALLLDDRAFYLAQDTIQLGVHTHSTFSGALSGNGLRQPKLTGTGVFAVESPVPVSEVEVIELDGSSTVTVDGDMMLMYSASLKVELRPLVRGLRNALRSGEGLVYVLSGRGTVYLTPTARRVSAASLPGTPL